MAQRKWKETNGRIRIILTLQKFNDTMGNDFTNGKRKLNDRCLSAWNGWHDAITL